jgi:hypothetical protein
MERNMDTGRRGDEDKETWEHRYGDMETWRNGDMATWSYGDMATEIRTW